MARERARAAMAPVVRALDAGPGDHAVNTLGERAARHGVADRYQSFWGEEKAVAEAVLRAAMAAMGVDPESEAADHEGFPAVHVALLGDPAEVRWAGLAEAG